MKKFFRLAVLLALLVSVSINGTLIASAAPSTESYNSIHNNSLDLSQLEDYFSKDEIEKMEEILESNEFQKEIEQGISLQPYIKSSDTFIEFDYEQALKDGLSLELVMKTKEDYDKANVALAKSQPQFTVKASQFTAKASCSGSNYYDGNIVAGTVYLSSCTVNKMVALLNGGAAASGLIALIPGGAPVAGVSVAIYLAGASVLSYNNADGKGVKIRVLRNPLNADMYPYWITSQ